jgi:hypothetical protein
LPLHVKTNYLGADRSSEDAANESLKFATGRTYWGGKDRPGEGGGILGLSAGSEGDEGDPSGTSSVGDSSGFTRYQRRHPVPAVSPGTSGVSDINGVFRAGGEIQRALFVKDTQAARTAQTVWATRAAWMIE